MKYCSKCGKEVLDEAEICPNCGCRIQPAKAEGKSVALDLGIAGLVCAVVAFFVFGWLSLIGLGLGIGAICVAKKETGNPKAKTGKGLGIAAVSAGGVALLLWAYTLLVLAGLLASL